MESIFTRRSIRKYTDKDINDKKLKSLLKAGMAAPSARNEQPWHFIIIREREKLNKITSIHPYSGMLKGAPLAILVCGDKRVLPDNSEEDFGYLIVDCSAATQNILLQAESEGLGAVWLGIYPRKERMDGLKELFSLPEHIVPVSLISVGYPAEKKPVNDRYLEERIHYNSFQIVYHNMIVLEVGENDYGLGERFGHFLKNGVLTPFLEVEGVMAGGKVISRKFLYV